MISYNWFSSSSLRLLYFPNNPWHFVLDLCSRRFCSFLCSNYILCTVQRTGIFGAFGAFFGISKTRLSWKRDFNFKKCLLLRPSEKNRSITANMRPKRSMISIQTQLSSQMNIIDIDVEAKGDIVSTLTRAHLSNYFGFLSNGLWFSTEIFRFIHYSVANVCFPLL